MGDARRAVEDRILSIPAATLAGLGAKAAVAAKYSCDVEIEAVRDLIEEVQRLAAHRKV